MHVVGYVVQLLPQEALPIPRWCEAPTCGLYKTGGAAHEVLPLGEARGAHKKIPTIPGMPTNTLKNHQKKSKLGGGFKHFSCSPLPGEMIQFD